MKLYALKKEIWPWNQEQAFGSETGLWGDFVADCYARLGMAPWDDEAGITDVPEDMAEYWRDAIQDVNAT